MQKPTKERFLENITSHTMEVRCNSGTHRHLTFSNNGSSVYKFHITTWPGYLAISGDMGSFMFSRLPDMFEFFRGDHINLGYWSEKLTAHEKHGGHTSYSEDLFVEALKSDFSGWYFESEDDRAKAWDAITDDCDGLTDRSSSAHDAIQSAMDWTCPVSGNSFQDFWEHRVEDYSYHFAWCCYAIQWAIQRYDDRFTAANDNKPNESIEKAA